MSLPNHLFESTRPNRVLTLRSGHFRPSVYDDYIRLIFFHPHREDSTLDNELSEESDQFRYLRHVYLGNLKGSVGLILFESIIIVLS